MKRVGLNKEILAKLAVTFMVIPQEHTVYVLSVWRFEKRPKSDK
jgi:hypothetical protein